MWFSNVRVHAMLILTTIYEKHMYQEMCTMKSFMHRNDE